MALPLYLAMTAAEIRGNSTLPSRLGYMACHFSPYGTGLSNLPGALPDNAMLILNDRTPIHGHDPELICAQLESLITGLQCECILLDFQRPECEETLLLAEKLCTLPCPVGISACYAADLDCPVFLPPVPPDVPLPEYLHPWERREIWLEAALDGMEITLTETGYSSIPLPYPHCFPGFSDSKLHCHYCAKTSADSVKFTLSRTREDLDALLLEAESLGVTHAVGLWQELSMHAETPA